MRALSTSMYLSNISKHGGNLLNLYVFVCGKCKPLISRIENILNVSKTKYIAYITGAQRLKIYRGHISGARMGQKNRFLIEIRKNAVDLENCF